MRNRPLLIAGAVLTLGLLASQAPRILASKQAVPTPAATLQAPTLPQPGVPAFLTPQSVHQLMQAGMTVRIGDVRKASSFDRRHIQGALSLPHQELQTWGPKLSKEEMLILYCT